MKSPKLFLPLFVFALIVAMVSFSARAADTTPLLQSFLDNVSTLLMGVEVTTEADGDDIKVTSTEISGETVTLGNDKVTVTDTTTTIANDVTVTGNANIQGIATLGDSKLVVTETETTINNQLCLNGECVSAWPMQIWNQGQNPTIYTTDKNISSTGKITAEGIETKFLQADNLVFNKTHFTGQDSVDTKMELAENHFCGITEVKFSVSANQTTQYDYACAINQKSDGYLYLNGACRATCTMYTASNLHSYYGCSAMNGTPVNSVGAPITTPGSYSFCRFDANICPPGWTQKGQWTTTTPKTCSRSNGSLCDDTRCTTNSHAWSDKNPSTETCTHDRHVVTWSGCTKSGVWECSNDNITQVGCY